MEATGKVNLPSDIFNFGPFDLVNMGFGNREAEKIVELFHDVHAPIENVLAAIGIPMWGRRMFAKLMSNSDKYDVERLKNLDFVYDEMIQIDEIGSAKAKVLCEAFKDPNTPASKFYADLIQKVTIDMPKGAADSPISGKSFCLSGTLPKGKHAIELDIVAAGGVIKSSVSKTLDYLVAGEGSGSKLEKATALGIPIITEDGLYDMLGDYVAGDYPEPERPEIPLCEELSSTLNGLT